MDHEDIVISNTPDEEQDPSDEDPTNEENGRVEEESDIKNDYKDEEDNAFHNLPTSVLTKEIFLH